MTGGTVVRDRAHLRELLQQAGLKHYTYILRRPDGVICFDGAGTPFYVGIGQSMRLFAHVDQAHDHTQSSRKLETIRNIWAGGGEVIHCIDRFHEEIPWAREQELITEIGQVKHGTGTLTNDQDYAPSFKIAGVELRKYASDDLQSADAIPASFKFRDVRLAAGPIAPKSRDSVFGKIYAVLDANPGVTGFELVQLLKVIDFSGNKSAYTQSGEVAAVWLCGYIEGGIVRRDRQHFQRYIEAEEMPAGRSPA